MKLVTSYLVVRGQRYCKMGRLAGQPVLGTML